MLPVNSAISIVDDDDSLRNSLNNLLRSLGFRADGFSSAEAFLTSSRQHETDCLILDVRMPGTARLGMNRSTLQFRLKKLGIVRPDIATSLD
jgi:FixJ family two-component response regulator